MTLYYESELYHHGVKGMRWGHRKAKLANNDYASFRTKRLQRAVNANDKDVASLKSAGYKKEAAAVKAVGEKNREKLTESQERDANKKGLSDKQKKAVKVGAVLAGTALTTYGAYKLNKYIRNENYKYHVANGEKIARAYTSSNKVTSALLDSHSNMMNIADQYGRNSKEFTKAIQKNDRLSSGIARVAAEKKITEARKASTDNFATAAKNVYRAKRNRF